jgi:hypothetical protein
MELGGLGDVGLYATRMKSRKLGLNFNFELFETVRRFSHVG